jgi:hypothetical protein
MTEAVHYPFPKIAQFRNVVKLGQKLLDNTEQVVSYIGRIKSHGCNNSISINIDDGSFYCQSRNRIIQPHDDNYGFASWVFANIAEIEKTLIDPIIKHYFPLKSKNIVIYGEWIGKGIQSGVAVSKIDKKFIVFSVGVVYESGQLDFYNNFFKFEPNPEIGIHHIDEFPIYELDIDFKNPQLAQDLLSQYTKEVEDCCPIGKYFGIEGIGEGLVFSPKYAYYYPTDFNFVFKSKGEKYSPSNVSTIGKVQIEGIEDINEMVNWLLDTSPENRVVQQLRILKELGTPMDDIKYIKCLIDAVLDDIDSEHKDDIISSGLPKKVIYGKLTKRIKEYYQNTLIPF